MDDRITAGRRRILVFDTREGMSDFMVEQWKSLAVEAISGKGRFAVALSGGRTPADFYRKLAALREGLPWDRTHVFPADERFVAPTHPDSNYGMLSRTLLCASGIPAENCHPVPVEEASAEKAAARYEEELVKFFEPAAAGAFEFDLVMLGIGEDGHTASLFPGSGAVSVQKNLAVAVTLGEPRHDRITLTLPVINGAKHVVFFVSGREKADVLRRVIGRDRSLPASLVDPERGVLLFVADREAAMYVSDRGAEI